MSDNNSTSPFPEMEPQLESAVWSVVNDPIDASSVERVKANAKQLARLPTEGRLQLEPLQPAQPRGGVSSWCRRKSGLLARFAVAALVLAAVGMAMIVPTSQNSAFAAAMEKLRTVKAFSFDQLTYLANQDEPIRYRVIVAADGRHRNEMDGLTTIHDKTGMVRLNLMPDKMAMTFDPVPGLSEFNQLEWLEALRSYGEPSKQLGEKEIDGQNVAGFEVNFSAHRLNVWVNTKTHQLSQIEHFPDPQSGNLGKIVSTNFNFNEQVDEALFSFEVPEGYEHLKLPDDVQAAVQEAVDNPEQNVIDALRGHAELAGGKFPKSLVNFADWIEVMVVDGKPNLDLSTNVGAMLPFLTGMKADHYEYLGDGMTMNQDERKIVFWYRNEEGKTRAIFSDLTVSDVEAADLQAPKHSQ